MADRPCRRQHAYNLGMNDDTLEQIQTKIAYLERTAHELSDVVFRQQKEIQALEAKLKEVSDRLNAVQSDQSPRPAEQERPPHY
jgi:SlyX protein